jgi:MoaA/NifB/PqqE/SkfB family radical SAM enzyme
MYDVAGLRDDPDQLSALRAAVDGAPPAGIRSAKIKLTARCNLRCSMCRFGRGWAPPELGEERFAEIVSELAALGCKKIHFSGGEVLVRNDLERLVARGSALGMKMTLTSNLTLLPKERVKALVRARPSSVSTSLDAAKRSLHDEIRGISGSFKRTVRSIERLVRERERRQRRVRIRINYTMMRQNYHEYPRLIELASRLGAVDVHAMPVDDGDLGSTLRLGRDDIRTYNTVVAPRVREARERARFPVDERNVYPFGRDPDEVTESAAGRYAASYYRTHPCYSPFLHVFVAWDGKVYLCCMTDGKIEPLGDLSTQSVSDVFHGEAFRSIRARMQRERLRECHRCDMVLDENRLLGRALRRLPSTPEGATS